MSDHDDDDLLLGSRPETAPPAAANDADAPAEADADALAAALDESDSGSSSDDDDGDNDNVAAAVGDATEEAAVAAAATGEVDPSAITSKKEAKKLLSKKAYKKWKKKHAKKSKKDKKGKKDKKKDSKKKKGASATAKKAAKGGKKGKKSRGSDDDDDADYAPSSDDEEGTANKSSRQARRTRAKKAAEDATYDFEGGQAASGLMDTQRGAGLVKNKMTANQRKNLDRANCERIIEKMEEARKADADAIRTGKPPINRIRLIPLVRAAANRIAYHPMLVEAGFLKEISNWMCSGKQLAPIDLRTTALNAMALFKIEHAEGGKVVKLKAKNDDVEDLDDFEGVNKDQLKESNLGFAANTVRQHPSETSENRAKASYLLQRMSRAFAGEVAELDNSNVKRWTTQGDSTILPPFEALKSSSELFVQKTTTVNPLDPTSYMRVPPMRFAKTYVSGVFNYEYKESEQQQQRRRQEAEEENA
jgi:hypothetical protein